MKSEQFVNKKIIAIPNDKSMLRINCTNFNFALQKYYNNFRNYRNSSVGGRYPIDEVTKVNGIWSSNQKFYFPGFLQGT